MNYPLISEYIEAVMSAEDNFNELSNLRPVLDDDGQLVMSSGNFAVVFKMRDEQSGKLHAVKCFLKEQEGRAEAYRLIAEELEYVKSTYLTPIEYLEDELYVDTLNSVETEFPVLLMDWVEGETLDNYVVNNKYDGFKLSCLAISFLNLSKWLLSQEFAHGDLKPDNIIVTEDDKMVLVDYDGMFVPKMSGQNAREQGTPNYHIPTKDETINDFGKGIDDFAIIHILLSLRVYSLFPNLISGKTDFSLFNYNEFSNISASTIFKEILSKNIDQATCTLLVLFQKCIYSNRISLQDLELLEFPLNKDNYVNIEEQMCSLDNILQAMNLAYSSMKYKDPARNEYMVNEYTDLKQRICLATEIQENLKRHVYPYDLKEYSIRYSYLKPDGIEHRDGVALSLSAYTMRYLYGLVKYRIVNKEISQNVFGGRKDVFTMNFNEDKYEVSLNDFVETQKKCANQYKYLYVFDIRNFFRNINISKLKDKYFDNHFSNVSWFDVFYNDLFEDSPIQGLNPCSEVDFFFANLYLESLDEKLAQINGIEYYRYCDDIRIFSNYSNLLDKLKQIIYSVLAPLGLELNLKKTKVIDTRKEQIELAKACFIWSSRLCFETKENTYLLKGKDLAKIIEYDLTTTYIFNLLKELNEYTLDDSFLNLHLDNLFYILKNVHKNATLYRTISEFIFDRGVGHAQNMLVFSEILKRIVEVLKDEDVEPYVNIG